MSIRHSAVTAAALGALALAAMPAHAKEEIVADEITRSLLQQAEFERIAVSPDGTKLAIARHVGESTTVTIHNRSDLKPLINFDPGGKGAISYLRWMDDQRLVVGATRIGTLYGFASFQPVLVVANLDGRTPSVLPGAFIGTVDGDPDHILVHRCGTEPGKRECNLPEIRLRTLQEGGKQDDTHDTLVIQGPADTAMIANQAGNAGFAIKFEDDDTGRTFVYQPADKTWSLLNDASKTKLEVKPIGVSRNGRSGFLQSQRKQGPDLVERYDFATGKRTPLYVDPVSNPLRLVASLDGQEILGAYYEPTNPKLHLWLPEHPDAKILTELQAAFPGKFVLIASASKDHNILVLNISSDRDPGTWYLFDRQARKASVLARESPWIDASKQSGMTPFTVRARDGLELHGLLSVPAGSTGKLLPLVVVPHGGPYWVLDSWGYDPEVQILTQHGYAVLQVNFRGSGGYGWQFIEKGERQWGRAMQDDVTDATRWAIAQGVADPDRICIYGASYGGYAALMGPIREPGLYKCAAAYAAPTDLSLMFRWGSIRRDDLGKRYLERVLGNDKIELAANSPAKLADRIGVPVLLAHGYRDSRVDIRHAHAMKSALARNKRLADYAEYSETGHFLMLDRHRLDFYARLLRLLDSNIGKPGGIAAGN